MVWAGNFYVCFSAHWDSTGGDGSGIVLTLCSFVALFFFFCFFFCFFVVFFCIIVFCFPICVVMLALWSPSSIVSHFAFCFTSCVVILAFWSSSTAAHFAFCFTSRD